MTKEKTLTKNLNADILVNLSNVASKKKVFEIFSSELFFPEYFGHNWDALYDCLTDLVWLPKVKTTITVCLPKRLSNNDKLILVRLLQDVDAYWEQEKRHIRVKIGNNN